MEADSKPILNFTTDDLLAELETMLTPEGEGIRTVEVARALNISRSKALTLLKALQEQGRIEPVRKRIVKFDNYETTTTAYRFKSGKRGQEDDD